MISDNEILANIILEYMPGADGPADSRSIADAILAAGFFRASEWEYSGGIEEGDGSITPWKPLRSPDALEEGYLLLHRPVGAWLEGGLTNDR